MIKNVLKVELFFLLLYYFAIIYLSALLLDKLKSKNASFVILFLKIERD